jgi:large subunit ribosomal protein L30
MAKPDQGTVRIKWVRSGIAFNRKQAEIVRALGLRRLHHVVERQDNPVVRGLIAKVPHLVEVIGAAKAPAWTSVPEYTMVAAAQASEQPARAEAEATAAQTVPAAQVVEPEAPADVAAVESEEVKPKRRARAPKAKPAVDRGTDAEAKD